MKRIIFPIVIVTVLAAQAATSSLVTEAMSSDPRVAGPAIAALRGQGQTGVDLLAMAPPQEPDRIAAYRAALDRVCRQRDCYTSRLFWFTDLEAAKAEAHASGKPILSLRLLGNLDEELSCANSRFFRTILYSDPKIAGYMRDHFVLHWSSERKVPIITVEFEDGRRIRQTITGNSIHYLLSEEGEPLDALPGLYSPEGFFERLEAFTNLAREYAATPRDQRSDYLAMYHDGEWRRVADLLGAGVVTLRTGVAPRKPTAGQAAVLTRVKTMAELPLLVVMTAKAPITDMEWKKIAERFRKEVHFAPESIALIRTKSLPAAFDALLANLAESVAEDTVRNEFDLHMKLHQWFVASEVQTLDALNRRVYDELFLTPRADPWLGLLAADRFTAIDNGGVTR